VLTGKKTAPVLRDEFVLVKIYISEQAKERAILEHRTEYIEAIKPQTLDQAIKDNMKLAKEWKVKVMPSMYFAEPNGKLLVKFEGGTVKDFLEKMNSVETLKKAFSKPAKTEPEK